MSEHRPPASAHIAVNEIPFAVDDDGYVRLIPGALLGTPLCHLISGLDELPAPEAGEGASQASISGYTEWVSTTAPALSIGWDWQLDVSRGLPCYVRYGCPRTNIMLRDPVGKRDLGFPRSCAIIEQMIDTLHWQEEVAKHIARLYA